jgi:Protein of unknown function (DUF1566)
LQPSCVAFLFCVLVATTAAAQQACDTRVYPLSTPTSRFEDNGDGTVTDKESRLMWLRCSIGQQWNGVGCTGQSARLDWSSAQAAATSLNRSGVQFFNDWRLPSLREMATIAERQCRNPRANLAVFPDMPAIAHWTSTPRPGSSSATSAFTLSFGDEGIENQAFDQPHAVRLVRPAQ